MKSISKCLWGLEAYRMFTSSVDQCVLISGDREVHLRLRRLNDVVIFGFRCSVSSPRENKGRLTLVQFNGLFNKTITPITRSTKRREGINPSENALKPQLIRLQLHIT